MFVGHFVLVPSAKLFTEVQFIKFCWMKWICMVVDLYHIDTNPQIAFDIIFNIAEGGSALISHITIQNSRDWDIKTEITSIIYFWTHSFK